MAKILIAMPAFAGCDAEVTESMMYLCFHLGRREPNHEFYCKVVGKKEQFRARNALVNIGLGMQADYIWFLDDDMVVPPDAFSKLMAHGKQAIGGLYYQRNKPFGPVVLMKQKTGNGYYPVTRDSGLHEVDVIGGGCMLLDMTIFDRMVEPYFTPEYVIGTDVQVCQRFQEQGVKIYADTSVVLGHVADPQAIYEPPVSLQTKRYAKVCKELCEDLSEFLGQDLETIGGHMQKALHSHVAEWEAATNPDDYYQNTGSESNLLRYVYYNMNDSWKIHHNEMFMETGWLRELGIEHILDYGCGPAFLADWLAQSGFNVTTYDLPSQTRDFVQVRSNKHKFSVRHCTPGAVLHKYNLILCTDVYEHLRYDWEVINSQIDMLTDGGYLCTNAHLMTFKTADEGQPQHLRTYDSQAFIDKMHKLGMVLVPSDEMQGHAGFFKKVR